MPVEHLNMDVRHEILALVTARGNARVTGAMAMARRREGRSTPGIRIDRRFGVDGVGQSVDSVFHAGVSKAMRILLM